MITKPRQEVVKESVCLPRQRSSATWENGVEHSGSGGLLTRKRTEVQLFPPTVPLHQQFSFAEDLSPTNVCETGGVRAHGGRRTHN